MRPKAETQLQGHEGLRLKPYRDTVGKLTIGFGRNLDDRGIRADEALILFDHDVADVEQELEAALPWFTTLDPVRQDVLTNMAFNLGVPGLLKFSKTLAHVAAGRYAEAATEMLSSQWAGQVGRRALELSTQMRTGVL